MVSSFRAEFLKLRKRPATWVLALVWATLVILFGYLLTYSFVSAPEDAPREQRAQQEAFNEELLTTLMPENLLENLFGNGTFGIGGAIVLILGSLAAGSEYVWSSLGFALAVLFRGTPLAIGLGLAYALAVENAIAALPIESDAFEDFRRVTLGENTTSVSAYFGSPPQAFGAPEPLMEPGWAALILAAYTVGFILLAAFFFRRRDVTT